MVVISPTSHLLTIILLCSLRAFAAPRVTISDGMLEGSVLQSRKGRDIIAFRGIPYARPPVGELRFQPPQPPVPWSGIRSATSDGDMCLQKKIQKDSSFKDGKIVGSEDCLYINVYTPDLPNDDARNGTQRYPVMVWFHGGAWIIGSGDSASYGPQYLLDHDIVLVTMNYRLGAFGFLSTADDVIPGNYALKDHIQALRWVQENIAAFGGNPGDVTIAGESAGAASVHYLMLSPAAEGLFHRGISQSGSAIFPVAFNTAQIAKNHAYIFGWALDCPLDTSERLLQCLQTKNAEEIMDLPGLLALEFVSIPFRPVMETNHPGAFITEDPRGLLGHHRTELVPWLTGTNAEELALIGKVLDNGGLFQLLASAILNNKFSEILSSSLGLTVDCPKILRWKATRKIREYYLGDERIDASTSMNLVNLTSDAMFNYATATAVKEHLRRNSLVYYYKLAYDGDVKKTVSDGNSKKDFGVGHTDDLLYLFPIHKVMFPNSTMSENDYRMVDVMTSLWTNFVRFGEPVPERTSVLPEIWEPVATDSLENFVIRSPTSLEMCKDMSKDMLDLWSHLPCHAGLCRSN